jgi:tungstate transport system permease protein
MDYIAQGFIRSIELLLAGDTETYSAIFTTLRISSLSIIASLIIGIPLGFLLGYFEFPGKRQVRAVVDTLLALPTVVVGLFVSAKRGSFLRSLGSPSPRPFSSHRL